MSTRAATWNWWNESLADVGVQAMDRSLPDNATWDDVLRSGREELAAAQLANQMSFGRDRRILDLGCGVGRVTFALAEQFGQVVGVDICPALIETAKSHNRQTNIQFDTVTGSPLFPASSGSYDTVFANEVYYYLDWPILVEYSRDAFRLLRSGGEYVFQLNMDPIGWKTRASFLLRSLLHSCGIRKWRGWTTSPDFIRKYHSAERVQSMLRNLGFEEVTQRVGRTLRQTWFIARKP